MPPIPQFGSFGSFGSSRGSSSFTSSILNPLNPISPLSPINPFNLSSPLDPTSSSLNDIPPHSNTPSYPAPGNETNTESPSYSFDTGDDLKMLKADTKAICVIPIVGGGQIEDTRLDGEINNSEAANIIAGSNEQSPADLGSVLSSTVGEEGSENFESEVKDMDIDKEITIPKETYQPSIHRGGFEGYRVLYRLENSTGNSEESLPAYTPKAE
ncbi:hypothetical protein TWF679_002031 [Orbilia oligospora]|uniref:Uncharacterized protein n=1 Tax=Orbilia oligospora TaxID=2813651 RepID=A0A8H8UUA1_ORBOL|nr:hypothetical protein TWF679_002031 [Orbilia oligospora]